MRQRQTTKTNLVEHGLDRGGIVRLPVARRALRPDADELVGRVVLVLRVAPPENPALRVEQARVLVDAGDPGLDEAPGGVRARVHVALRPRVDDDGVACFAGEEHGPVGDADGGGDVVQEDVVQDERAVEAAAAREGVLDENGRVGHDGVDDRLAAGALDSTLLWHLQRNIDLSFLAQELINIDARSSQAWIAVGNCFSLQKDRSQAMTCFRRAAQLDTTCAYAYTLSGHESLDDDLEKAINYYQSALRVDARHYNAW